jgi:hypothetical protein
VALGENLDCSRVKDVVGNFGVVIITPGSYHFVLSCWLAPTDAPSVQHG